DRPAARAAWRDQADVAVLLQTETRCLTPFVRHVVVIAARVNAKIASDGSRVAQRRRRNMARRFRVAGESRFQKWVMGGVVERDACSDDTFIRSSANRAR